ncbi:hypothetical protein D3C76_1400060 [compost metagenome]
MADIRRQMSGFSIPFQGSLFVPKDSKVSDSFCITFAQGYSYSGAGGVVVPVGTCAQVIKPTMQCEIKGNTNINHGNVSDAAIDGNEAATTLQLTCTGESSVIAKLSSAVNLRADRSLYSKLTVGGKSAQGGVEVFMEKDLPRPVVVKSTLFSSGTVEPGAFSGSTVLTIAPP